MSDRNDDEWRWYAGRQEGLYEIGPFDSKESAAHEAGHSGLFEVGDTIYLVEACKDDLKLSNEFHAEAFLEGAEDSNWDPAGENGDAIFDVTVEQIADLEFVVRATIDRWQRRQKLTFTPWVFTGARNYDETVFEGAE